MKLKKILAVMTVSAALFAPAGISYAETAPQTETSHTVAAANEGMESLRQAVESMDKLKSYDMHTIISLKSYMINGNLDVNSSTYDGGKSQLTKMDIKVTLQSPLANSLTYEVPVYVEDDGVNSIEYFKIKDEWKKKTSPSTKKEDKKNSPEEIMGTIRTASVIGRERGIKQLKVVIDGKLLARDLKDIMKNTPDKELQKAASSIADNLGDITFFATQDLKNGCFTEVHADISKNMQKVLYSMMGSSTMPKDEKKMVEDIIDGSTVTFECDIAHFDRVAPFAIPDEAKQAEESKDGTAKSIVGESGMPMPI